MGMLKEFKEFAVKGNVMDLAIGVIIGAAFGKIVSSLVDDVITPLILKPLLDVAHLSKLEDLKIFGTVKYGTFLAAIINFIIVAFALFLVVRFINRLRRDDEETPAAPPAPTTSEKLLMEIRDELKKKS